MLFDAVAILPSAAGAALLASDAASKDFVSDAFEHCKFVGYSPDALALFAEALVPAELDEGLIRLGKAKNAKAFVTTCGKLRFWPREMTVDLDAASVC